MIYNIITTVVRWLQQCLRLLDLNHSPSPSPSFSSVIHELCYDPTVEKTPSHATNIPKWRNLYHYNQQNPLIDSNI
ncbi:hypothetical protein CsSME_00028039 [Camellia sinensis var. sinensis]